MEPVSTYHRAENPVKGVKHDAEKPRWDLLPLNVVRQVVEVLTYGCNKYGPDNWKKVGGARDRYFAAAMRHLEAWQSGNKLDVESRMPHLSHAICCLLFLLWFENNEDKRSIDH